MNIKAFQFNMFGVNTYIVWDPESKNAAIVDPGMISDYDTRQVEKFIDDNSLQLKHLVNTHLHLDHTFGNDFIKKRYNMETEANTNDAFLGNQRQGQARMFGIDKPIEPLSVDVALKDGDKIQLGEDYLLVIEVPGHSPGSIALYSPSSKFVITGDALFQGSIGRTDLPGGDHEQLIGSISQKLFTLPPETTVYPGHGPSTTIANERKFNPYF